MVWIAIYNSYLSQECADMIRSTLCHDLRFTYEIGKYSRKPWWNENGNSIAASYMTRRVNIGLLNFLLRRSPLSEKIKPFKVAIEMANRIGRYSLYLMDSLGDYVTEMLELPYDPTVDLCKWLLGSYVNICDIVCYIAPYHMRHIKRVVRDISKVKEDGYSLRHEVRGLRHYNLRYAKMCIKASIPAGMYETDKIQSAIQSAIRYMLSARQ